MFVWGFFLFLCILFAWSLLTSHRRKLFTLLLDLWSLGCGMYGSLSPISHHTQGVKIQWNDVKNSLAYIFINRNRTRNKKNKNLFTPLCVQTCTKHHKRVASFPMRKTQKGVLFAPHLKRGKCNDILFPIRIDTKNVFFAAVYPC